MTTMLQKMQCEWKTRELLERGDLPQPDRVEYGEKCIRLFWDASKLVLVVEIDDPPQGFAAAGKSLGDFEADDERFDDLEGPDQDEPFEYPQVDEDDALEELEKLDDEKSEEVA